MLHITYVFGGARGIGRVERARKLANLMSTYGEGVTLKLVACEDVSKWPSKATPPVISYRFGEVPAASCFERSATSAVLIDGYPDGPAGAARSLLPQIREFDPHRKIVLVMRDILDAPDRVRARLANQGGYELLQQYYDGVVVLGRREIFDVKVNYQLPDERPVYYLGYLPPTSASSPQIQSPNGPCSVLVSAGGGDDADWMPRVISELSHEGCSITAVTGPNMPSALLREVCSVSRCGEVCVLHKVDSLLPLLRSVDFAVISGGYNTLLEAVFSGTAAIVIPREDPTSEQLIRARSIADNSIIRVLRRRELDGTGTLRRYIRLMAEMRRLRPGLNDRANNLFSAQGDVAWLLDWLEPALWYE